MAKLPTYTEVYVLKVSKEQKQTLDKIKERGFVSVGDLNHKY